MSDRVTWAAIVYPPSGSGLYLREWDPRVSWQTPPAPPSA